MTDRETLHIEQHIDASPPAVYRAFTARLPLRMWLCADAQVDPRLGGRIFLWWADGYYAAGEFVELEPNARIAWQWHGRGEPGTTRLVVSFSNADGGTNVTLDQIGLGIGDDWVRAAEALRDRWAKGLENLASVWSGSGVDLRQARRPMLGIYLGDFVGGADQNLPGDVRGMKITGTVEGSGAETCGLVRGDIVTELNGIPLTDFGDFATARRDKRAGDSVPLTYYRDGERTDTSLTFSAPPAPPDVPVDPGGLAGIIEDQYAVFATEMAEILADVSEDEAKTAPAEGAWSVREVLAHLVLFERCFHQWIAMFVEGEELATFAAAVAARVKALLVRFPSIAELLAELRACRAETVTMLRSLSEMFVGRPEYVRMGQIMIGEDVHTRFHHGQLRRTIAAIREVSNGSTT
jgi:uncharacterized protein YndB with AHSA1/START domain